MLISSSTFSRSLSRKVPSHQAETAGAIMAFFLSLGLALGAAISFALRDMVQNLLQNLQVHVDKTLIPGAALENTDDPLEELGFLPASPQRLSSRSSNMSVSVFSYTWQHSGRAFALSFCLETLAPIKECNQSQTSYKCSFLDSRAEIIPDVVLVQTVCKHSDLKEHQGDGGV